MAVVETLLAAWETTAFAADKPLIASQSIPTSPAYAKWVEVGQVGAGNITTWTDRTDSDFPIRRAYDGYPHLVTKTDATAANEWYLAFDFGSAIDFDCAFLIGTNMGTVNPVTLDLQVADDNAFSTNLKTIGTFTASNDRMQDYVLSDGSGAARWTAQYAWLKIARVANFTPEIGELILGRRRQMQSMPLNPFDPTSLHDEIGRSRSMGGISHTTVFHRRRFELSATFSEHEDTYINGLIGFWQECNNTFVWCWEPTTTPGGWNLMSKDADFDFPSEGWTERTVTLTGSEQGPEEYFLDQE